jgi:TonB family protein
LASESTLSADPEGPRGSELTLASATDSITVTDDMDSQLAGLGLGRVPTPEETPEPAPEVSTPKPRPVDRGLGGPGGRTISTGTIKRTIQVNQGQVKACYERELKNHESLRGKVVVGWTIGADGRVRSPRIISNTTGNRGMSRCIKKAIRGWQFPAAESPQDIEYPFVFKPRAY